MHDHAFTTRRWLPVATIMTMIALAVTACDGDPHPTPPPTPSTTTHAPAEQAAVSEPAKVTTTPAHGATGVNPAKPVTLHVSNGTIVSVVLTSSTGNVIKGMTGPNLASWTSTQKLGYGHRYTWSGSAKGADGKVVPISGSFTTVFPTARVSGRMNVVDGATYGVAMPIVINFSSAVPDAEQDDVQRALSVSASPHTEGSWAWLSHTSVHWRPKEFWASGTEVTVHADLLGVPFGNGRYGASDETTQFTIGKNQKITGDTRTHRLQLVSNGKVVHDFPTSYGLDSVLWRNTRSGVHVVMAKFPTFYMTNPRGNYENVFVRWAVRISNNGEFIHAYPPTRWVQGKYNVSHGCLNLTTARAKTVYDWVQIGDPVDITGSRVQLSAADGAYYDWTLSWNDWLSKSAVS